jgi:hypothetical protein
MRTLIIAAAIVASLSSVPAMAQQSPQNMMMGQPRSGAMMGSGWMEHHMQWRDMMPMMSMMDPSRHIEGRLAFLKAELRITEAQASQWNAYIDAARANADRMGDAMDQMMSSRMMMGPMMSEDTMMGGYNMMMHEQSEAIANLPDRFALAEKHLTAQLETLQAMKEPTMQLYGVLSDEQKRLADQFIGPMGMMGMM